MIEDYERENETCRELEAEEPMASPMHLQNLEGLKKKQRKAQKKAARASMNNHAGVIKQCDLERLEAIIFPTDTARNAEDEELVDALSIKFLPNVFSEKRIMDSLMSPPNEAPQPDQEATRVIAELQLGPQLTKMAKVILERIAAAIKEDVVVHWNTDTEMRKRRIVYAQWVSKGAVEKMATHYEEWDISTGARTVRRYQADDRGPKGKEGMLDEDDELDDDDGISVLSGVTLLDDAGLESGDEGQHHAVTPAKDDRRGGIALPISGIMPVIPPESRSILRKNKENVPMPRRKQPILSIVPPTNPVKKGKWSTPITARTANYAVQPPMLFSPDPRTAPFPKASHLDLSIPMPMPGPRSSPWTTKASRVKPPNFMALVEQDQASRTDLFGMPTVEDGPVHDDNMPIRVMRNLRVLPPPKVEEPEDDDAGWAVAGRKKGKKPGYV